MIEPVSSKGNGTYNEGAERLVPKPRAAPDGLNLNALKANTVTVPVGDGVMVQVEVVVEETETLKDEIEDDERAGLTEATDVVMVEVLADAK